MADKWSIKGLHRSAKGFRTYIQTTSLYFDMLSMLYSHLLDVHHPFLMVVSIVRRRVNETSFALCVSRSFIVERNGPSSGLPIQT